MATPTFVKFSRICGDVFDVLHDVDVVVRRHWQCQMREVVRLAPSYSDYDGGLRLDGEFQVCHSPREARDLSRDSDSFAFIYLATEIPAEFCFYLFEMQPDQFSATLAFDSSMVYFKSEAFESGQWLEGLLITIVCALKPLVSGYGSDAAYSCKHESLNPTRVLERLRSGKLFQLPRPIFHAISTSLIEQSEIDSLIEQHQPKLDPKYRMAPGYHIFGSIGL